VVTVSCFPQSSLFLGFICYVIGTLLRKCRFDGSSLSEFLLSIDTLQFATGFFLFCISSDGATA